MHRNQNFTMEQPGVVAGNFGPSFLLNFLSIFVHMSGSLGLITMIWASLERSFPPAEVERRWCQFWSKVMTSEVEEKPRLVNGGYGWHRSQWINILRIELLSVLHFNWGVRSCKNTVCMQCAQNQQQFSCKGSSKKNVLAHALNQKFERNRNLHSGHIRNTPTKPSQGLCFLKRLVWFFLCGSIFLLDIHQNITKKIISFLLLLLLVKKLAFDSPDRNQNTSQIQKSIPSH